MILIYRLNTNMRIPGSEGWRLRQDAAAAAAAACVNSLQRRRCCNARVRSELSV